MLGSFPFRVGKSFLLLNCYIGIYDFKIQVTGYQKDYDSEVSKCSNPTTQFIYNDQFLSHVSSGEKDRLDGFYSVSKSPVQ
jgi:hypothetical protein